MRVEPRQAEPVTGGDERRGLEISDQAMRGDRRVIHGCPSVDHHIVPPWPAEYVTPPG
ncbi:MAG TPA: hypothetical protein VGH53_07090 [Streptosporangiaceae bacterium]